MKDNNVNNNKSSGCGDEETGRVRPSNENNYNSVTDSATTSTAVDGAAAAAAVAVAVPAGAAVPATAAGAGAGAAATSSKGPLATTEHLGKHRQYWRDIILGVNDGIVSTFLLVTGVAGGGLSSQNILLTAIAGALAGAVSMFAGEYVATKSQNEVLTGEIKLERVHVQNYPGDEVKELDDLLDLIGIPTGKQNSSNNISSDAQGGGTDDTTTATAPTTIDLIEAASLRQQLLRYYEHNPEAMLKVMIALEFGVIEGEMRSPGWAGTTSLTSFAVGSLPSLLPFAFAKNAHAGLIAAAVLTFMALTAVGMVKTWATRGNLFKSAGENLLIASIGAGLAYAVGFFFDHVLN